MTSMLLKRIGVPVPNGRLFQKEDIKGIIDYAQHNYPVVLKKNNGAQGQDVYINIKDIDHLFGSIHGLLKNKEKEIIVEDFILGKDYRIIVFRGVVIDVIKRVPAYIIGDGIHTIRELIDQKNTKRLETLGGSLIKRNSGLLHNIQKLDLKLTSILTKDKFVQLNSSCNYSVGGETKRVSIKSVHPDNLDYITKDISKSWKETCSVINEVNSSIGIDIHYYADMAMDLSAPKKVLSMYFELK